MPPLPAVPGVLRVAVEGLFGVANWANVFHVQYTGDVLDDTNAGFFASDFLAAYSDNFKALMSTAWSTEQCNVTDLSSDTAGQGTDATHTAGTHSGDILSAQSAIVISWKISRRYRGGHPRTYLCGITQDRLTSSTHVTGAFADDVHDAAVAFAADVEALATPSAHTWKLACVHYMKDKAPLDEPTVDVFTSATVDSRVDSQRRRLGTP